MTALCVFVVATAALWLGSRRRQFYEDFNTALPGSILDLTAILWASTILIA